MAPRSPNGRSVGREAAERPVSCLDLERVGLWNVAGCCEACHSTERLVGASLWIGPCSAEVGGARVSCCCAVKKALGRE